MRVILATHDKMHRNICENSYNNHSHNTYCVLNKQKPDQVTFTGQPNAEKLRKLIKHGVHCMFCDTLLIDGKEFIGLMKSGLFQKPSSEVMNKMEKYQGSLQNSGAKVFKILQEYSQIFPDKTIEEIIQILKSSFERRLIQKQSPIFRQILEKSKALPPQHQVQMQLFMEETQNKILGKPVKVPFSSYEFQYKLEQIKKYALATDSKDKAESIGKLISIAEKFSDVTNNGTQPHQIKILKKIKKAVIQNNLKEDKKVTRLIDHSFKRLFGEPMNIKFSKKSFMYDLYKTLAGNNDKTLNKELLSIGEKLPTSHQSTSAYIMKYTDENAEKLFFGLFEQSFYSADHIKARSKGGKNKMANYGPACRKCNTNKGSKELEECIDKDPKIKTYIKKSFDDMVRLNNNGIFKQINLGTNYLNHFTKTIFKESGNYKLKLDKSDIKTHYTSKVPFKIKDLLTNVKFYLKRLNFFTHNAD